MFVSPILNVRFAEDAAHAGGSCGRSGGSCGESRGSCGRSGGSCGRLCSSCERSRRSCARFCRLCERSRRSCERRTGERSGDRSALVAVTRSARSIVWMKCRSADGSANGGPGLRERPCDRRLPLRVGAAAGPVTADVDGCGCRWRRGRRRSGRRRGHRGRAATSRDDRQDEQSDEPARVHTKHPRPSSPVRFIRV